MEFLKSIYEYWSPIYVNTGHSSCGPTYVRLGFEFLSLFLKVYYKRPIFPTGLHIVTPFVELDLSTSGYMYSFIGYGRTNKHKTYKQTATNPHFKTSTFCSFKKAI